MHTFNGVGISDSVQAGEMSCEEAGDWGEAGAWWMWTEITQVARENEKFTNTGQSSKV